MKPGLSLMLISLQFCGTEACIAAPRNAAPAEQPVLDTAFALPNGSDVQIDPFTHRSGAWSPDTSVMASTTRDPQLLATTSASATPQTAIETSQSTRRDKWVLVLSALALISWQLRRKQMSLRSGQLYSGQLYPTGLPAYGDEQRRLVTTTMLSKQASSSDTIPTASL
jgi:hypothetical protein